MARAPRATAPEGYDPSDYPPVGLTADLVLLTIRGGEANILLVQRDNDPYAGAWALPGGFVNPDENSDEAAARELEEETGVAVALAHLEQLRTYTEPDRDPRMRVASVAYLGLLPDLPDPVAGSDARSARWWPVRSLADAGALAFDHASIVADGLERARAKLEYTTLATMFLPEEFTIPQLRSVYEAIWNCTLHRSNFARKVTQVDGFLRESGNRTPGGRGQGPPAKLYTAGDADLVLPPIMRPEEPE